VRDTDRCARRDGRAGRTVGHVFDIGMGELLVLVLAALFVFGPDRLPQVTAQAVRVLRQVRAMASGAREQLNEAIGPELEDLDVLKDLRDLNQLNSLRKLDPRAMITSAIMDDGSASTTSPRTANGNGRRAAPATNGDGPTADGAGVATPPATFDPDAT
jgi:sec-independent protein translocase protein TatB